MKNQIELVTSLIKDIKFCMFTTKSEEGKLYSRPMGIIQDEINLSEGIYFSRETMPLRVKKSKRIIKLTFLFLIPLKTTMFLYQVSLNYLKTKKRLKLSGSLSIKLGSQKD